jgi:hypothetical protein
LIVAAPSWWSAREMSYCVVVSPSMTSPLPIVKAASSETRNTTASAISLSLPQRLPGIHAIRPLTAPSAIVMSAENLVDAALAGLDQGETVTIPSLPDKAEWDAFETARRNMSGKLSSVTPAPGYGI